ncbi:PQQ-like beta-propeller repeat protein, partial [candidate division WOR-3 bacterium]|nr:PQQ-like beta-propeller repeat protein [candidate division WOR-3 bacterium]
SDSLSSGLRALHPDGSDKWVFPTSKAIIASPIVRTDGGPCFACADSFVYCLDTAGRLRWRTRLALGGGHLYFEPAIGSDGTIYVGALDSLAAIDSSGVLKWRIPLDLPYCAGLAIGSDGTIYGGNPLTAMRPDGSVIWRRDSRSTGAPAIGSDGTIYQPSHDTLFAIGPAGSVKWAFISPCGTSTPAVAADGTVYFADYMPFVHALGPNGRELWRGEDPGSGSEGVTVALGLDGTVLSTACCACLCAFAGTSPLADSPWPKFQRDLSNSGRAGP